MLDQRRHPTGFVHLTTVGDATIAQILAAKLRAEGIEVRVHGGAQSVYPVTVGALAEAQLWVLSDRVEEASRLLLDAEINDTLEPITRSDRPQPTRTSLELRVVALVVGVVLIGLWVLRLLAVY
jgi:hypothetical protein